MHRPDAPTLVSRRAIPRFVKIGLGIAFGAVFFILLSRQIDFAKVGRILAGANGVFVTAAVFALSADFCVRALRFCLMLRAGTGLAVGFKASVGPFIASFGINDVLPLRAGDGFRAIWFHRRFRIPLGAVIGTMLVERLLDLASVVVLGAAALVLVGGDVPPALLLTIELVLAAAVAGWVVIVFAPGLLARMIERVAAGRLARPAAVIVAALNGVSGAVAEIRAWRRLLAFGALSLSCWLLEGVVFLAAWLSLGGPWPQLAKPFLAFAFGTLGTIVPSLPGHFGSYEYFGVEAFRMVGVEASFAASVIILAHLVLWIPTATFGAFWLATGGFRLVREGDGARG